MKSKIIFNILLLTIPVIGYSSIAMAENKAAIEANEVLLEKLVCAEYLSSRDLRSVYHESLAPNWNYYHHNQKTEWLYGEAPMTCGGFSSKEIAILNSLEKNTPTFRDAVIKPLIAGKKANEINTQYFIKAISLYPSQEKVTIIPSKINETADATVVRTRKEVHEYVILALKKQAESSGNDFGKITGDKNGAAFAIDHGFKEAAGTNPTANNNDKEGANGATSATKREDSSAAGLGPHLAAFGVSASTSGGSYGWGKPTGSNGNNGNDSNKSPSTIPTDGKTHSDYPPVDNSDHKTDSNGSSGGAGGGIVEEDQGDAVDIEPGFEHCTGDTKCDDVLKDAAKDAYQNQMALAVNPSPAYTYRDQPGYQDQLNDKCIGDADHCQKSENGWRKAVEAAGGKAPSGSLPSQASNAAKQKVKLCSFLGFRIPCNRKG